MLVVVEFELLVEEDGAASGPDKFEFEFELTRIVVVLFDVDDDEVVEDEEVLEDEGAPRGPKVPALPAVLKVTTLVREVFAA